MRSNHHGKQRIHAGSRGQNTASTSKRIAASATFSFTSGASGTYYESPCEDRGTTAQEQGK